MSGFLWTNFLAAERKRNLIPFFFFPATQDITWIADTPGTPGPPGPTGPAGPVGPPGPAGGILITFSTMTGTVDGSNAVFGIPITVPNSVSVYKNGVLQQPTVMYTQSGPLSAVVITFLDPYVPLIGDVLGALVS